MSKSPKTIDENAKLSEAEKLMRRYNIHSLVVINDRNEFVGIIDAFSCM
jgi:arabinose-5-phosphate isomerase